MEMSENINELATALSRAQAIIDNPSKDSENPFFKSRYSSLAEVLNVVRPAFSVNGLAIMQHPSIEDGTVTLTTILSHTSGQWVKSSISAPAGKDIQASGSAITYCRRYALSAIAGVAQEDDDGTVAAEKKHEPKQAKEKEPVKMSSDWEKEADQNCKTVEELGKWYKASFTEINKMDKLEIGKINAYVSQLKAVIIEGQTKKAETIICPESDEEVLKDSCAGKRCLSGCPVLQPVTGSKLDMSGVK